MSNIKDSSSKKPQKRYDPDELDVLEALYQYGLKTKSNFLTSSQLTSLLESGRVSKKAVLPASKSKNKKWNTVDFVNLVTQGMYLLSKNKVKENFKKAHIDTSQVEPIGFSDLTREQFIYDYGIDPDSFQKLLVSKFS